MSIKIKKKKYRNLKASVIYIGMDQKNSNSNNKLKVFGYMRCLFVCFHYKIIWTCIALKVSMQRLLTKCLSTIIPDYATLLVLILKQPF